MAATVQHLLVILGDLANFKIEWICAISQENQTNLFNGENLARKLIIQGLPVAQKREGCFGMEVMAQLYNHIICCMNLSNTITYILSY